MPNLTAARLSDEVGPRRSDPSAGLSLRLHPADLRYSCRQRVTCRPSPCGRLSWPRTTMAALFPWGSPPVGNPVFRADFTFERLVGSRLIPLNSPLVVAGRPDLARSRRTSLACQPHPVLNRISGDSFISAWGFGFKQFSLSHETRACEAAFIAVNPALRFSCHAIFAPPFRARLRHWPRDFGQVPTASSSDEISRDTAHRPRTRP
jgi:hypothetical protein